MIAYLLVPLAGFLLALYIIRALNAKMTASGAQDIQQTNEPKKEPKKAFAVPDPSTLNPPLTTQFTAESLSKYNGSDAALPIYVAIKGSVFDVTSKREMYGKGGSYNVFAGKDASVALGKSSLKLEDAVADYSGLDADERQVLDDWEKFFKLRYSIVGQVVKE